MATLNLFYQSFPHKNWLGFGKLLRFPVLINPKLVRQKMPLSKKWNTAGSSSRKVTKGDGIKAKKKSTKKKNITSEDAKARQLEQRAAVEEERRRLREELINSFLKVGLFYALF